MYGVTIDADALYDGGDAVADIVALEPTITDTVVVFTHPLAPVPVTV